MRFAPLVASIEAAFDGVPPPGPGSRTLHEAELTDWGQPDSRPDDWHERAKAPLGRWQDITLAHLNDCKWALAHLDAHGLRYFLPAILVHHLRWVEADEFEDTSLYVDLCDSLSMLSSLASYKYREHKRAWLSLFDVAQRRVIFDFLTATSHATSHDEADIATWRRVIDHDASGAPGDWFEAYWPERERPASEHVVALLEDAFGVSREAIPASLEDTPSLLWRAPEDFRSALPIAALFVLQYPDDDHTPELVAHIESAFRPLWGSEFLAKTRAQLEPLSPAQRVAISAFADACIDDDEIRAKWRRAIAHQGPDWFERLKLP